MATPHAIWLLFLCEEKARTQRCVRTSHSFTVLSCGEHAHGSRVQEWIHGQGLM
jgi:hypothetical protein